MRKRWAISVKSHLHSRKKQAGRLSLYESETAVAYFCDDFMKFPLPVYRLHSGGILASMNDIVTRESGKEVPQGGSNWMIPISIMVAGILVAGAIIFSGPNGSVNKQKNEAPIAAVAKGTKADNIRPVSASEHILGSPTAKVFVIEYSDTECPFCKNFHQTMHQIMNEYGKDGRVAWVYRQFPIVSLHPKAEYESEATECVAELGGNTKFWEYLDIIFERTPSNNGLETSKLFDFAAEIGISRGSLEACLNSDRNLAKIEADLENGVTSGVTGTPYSFVVNGAGQKFIINGALPYSRVKAIIDTALAKDLFN